MGTTLKNIWNGITDLVDEIVNSVVLLLPDSPFANIEIPSEVVELMGYVNYFVPIAAMLVIGSSWLIAIGSYYLYQTILRWTQTIK